MLSTALCSPLWLLTLLTSRSGTVGGLGGQEALRLFLLRARDMDPVTKQATTTTAKVDFMFLSSGSRNDANLSL